MLSLFPSLLYLEPLAPFLLRLTLGIVFLGWAYKKVKQKNVTWSIIEGILGVLFIVGFLTQLAALVSTLLFAFYLYQKIRQKSFLTDGVNYYFILLIISLTLLISGPGAFAFDLPL